MESLSEVEYAKQSLELQAKVRAGVITIKAYHDGLKKLSAKREMVVEKRKPVVHISDVEYERYPSGSLVAHGFAHDHPRLGRMHVRTSLITSKADDGSSFETLNTSYVIVQDDYSPDEIASEPDDANEPDDSANDPE